MPNVSNKLLAVTLVALMSVAQVGCGPSRQQQKQDYQDRHEDQMHTIKTLMDDGFCDAAAHLISRDYSGFFYLRLLSAYQLHCRKNRERSIVMLSVLAEFGDEKAAEGLRSLGLTPPPTRMPPVPPVVVSNRVINVGPDMPATPQRAPASQTQPQLNVQLIGTEDNIGHRLCHYSNGTTTRVGAGAICPR